MKITDQFIRSGKEYTMTWSDLKEKFNIHDDIDHMYFDGDAVVLVTKWKRR